MGAGATVGIVTALSAAKDEDLDEIVSGLPAELLSKLKSALNEQESRSDAYLDIPEEPGDVAVCGTLPIDMLQSTSQEYKSWLFLTPCKGEEDAAGILAKNKVKYVGRVSFPEAPEHPSEEQAGKIVQAIDTLPRPLMIQSGSGKRAGAALLLWMITRQGYSTESAKKIAMDAKLKLIDDPLQDWIFKASPA